MGLIFLTWVGGARAQAPEELLRFPATPDPGETNGLLNTPMAIAANPDTGHLYVGETGNHRISEFTSEGVFIRAWGWGVVASGPDNNPQNEVQKLSVTASSGTFALVFTNPFNDGGASHQQTAPIAFDASAPTIQAALEALESPAPGDVNVTSPNPTGGPWTIEFVGKYADTDIAPLEVSNSTLVGSASVETTQGGAHFEVCEDAAGDVCRAGQEGGFSPGQLHGVVEGLTLDPDGNVYVFEQDQTIPHARIQKFSPSGEFLLMMGGEVNKNTNGDLCTAAEVELGAICGRGVPGTSSGQFDIATLFEPHRLAIGPNNVLYVGDNGRVQELELDGTFKGEFPAAGFVENIAVDSAGKLYVDYLDQADIFKYEPEGTASSPVSFPLGDPGSLAIDPGGNLYAVEDPPSFGTPATEARIVKFDPIGNKLIPTPEEEAQNKFFAQIHPSGLATLRCAAGQGLGALYVTDFRGHVTAYGSNPGCGIALPKVTDRYAVSVGTGEATIAAKINPNGNETTYYVEYGTEPCDTSTCAQVPVAPGKALEDQGGSAVLREVALSGLEPGTTYHYRVVATATTGTDESAEGIFTTRRPDPGVLPDGRGFEMVSPSQKNSADIAPKGGTANFLMQAAEVAPGLVYPSATPFADPESAPPSSAYLGTRADSTPEWTTKHISPEGAALEQQVKALSADLSTAAVVSSEPPLCCGATNGIKNLYLRDLATGTYTLVTDVEPQLTVSKSSYCVGIQGYTRDFSRVFFKANGALTEDAPAGSGANLYEWTKADGIRLVSILPGETPATPAASTSLGRPAAGLAPFCEAERILDNAVSEDGSKAVWTNGSALYDRIDGSETVQLDLPQGGPGAAGTGQFWAASDDGSKVFFTASSLLTPGAHAGDLYRYDFDQPAGSRLTDLTGGANAAAVKGVVASSEAGDAVYFVANGVLADNEGAAVDSKQAPEKAKAGHNNLYLWREGIGIIFIGTFAPSQTSGEPTSDASAWDASPQARNAATTADGDTLAFTSVEPLTGYESSAQGSGEQTRQVFLYDADSDELTCASCNPTGERPLGPDEPWNSSSDQPGLATWKTAFTQPRYLSADGRRLLFESFDSLVAEDTNDARDVYEFERPGKGDCTTASPTYWAQPGGCIDLVSSAPEGSESFFLDASADGNEAYISTAAPLAPIDTDEKYDAYDVRIGAQAQTEPNPVPICDEVLVLCRHEKQEVPALTPPSSSPPLGSGNVPTKKPCPKGKVRRNGKCVKKHHKRKHHHKKQKAHRQGGSGR